MAFKIPNFYKQTFQAPNSKGPAPSTHSKQSPLDSRGGGDLRKPSVSYDEAYDAQSEEKKKTQTREEFKKAAKAYNAKKYGTTEPTRDSKKAGKTKEELALEVKARNEKKEETKPVENKDKVVKNEEPKNRRQKRADRIKKRKEKKKAIKEIKESGLKGKEKREAKRAVREKVGKTKVGKALKSAKDKVVGDALGNEVKKDSPVENKNKRLAKKAARLAGRQDRVEDKAYEKGSKRKAARAEKIGKKREKTVEKVDTSKLSDKDFKELRKKRTKVSER